MSNNDIDGGECPICFMEFVNKHTTSCNHNFCYDCLHEWLKNHNSCPVCRGIIGPNGYNGHNIYNGYTGSGGPLGITGPISSNYYNYLNGLTGYINQHGPSGYISQHGPSGYNSQHGPSGYIGVTGPSSYNGVSGPHNNINFDDLNDFDDIDNMSEIPMSFNYTPQYFNYVQPYNNQSTSNNGIHSYSFALHPSQYQPSGTANISRIGPSSLNVLRITSGMGGLQFYN